MHKLEEVNIRSRRSQAKILGTIATVILGTVGSHNEYEATHIITGAVFITIGCLSWASFVILQVSVSI